MTNTLKFTGTFKNLKNLGCEFMKLYASNYKVYMKESGYKKFWVWVANGGYIEFDDFYSNTKNIVEAIKSINWDDIKGNPHFGTDKLVKKVFIRVNHNNPSKGYELSERSLESEQIFAVIKKEEELGLESGSLYKGEYLPIYEKLREDINKNFDRDLRVTEEFAKEFLTTYEELQNC